MGRYDFHSLLEPYEFEALACDIIQIRDTVTLERYKEGRDLGIDGFFQDEEMQIIVQAKRYKQDFNILFRVLKKQELPKVKKLNPDRYILCVSMDFQNKLQKQKIVDLFEGYILNTNDILSGEDLNNLLRDSAYKTVELNYPKLWLPSINVLNKQLDKVVNKSNYRESAEQLKEALRVARIFVPTKMYHKALNRWKKSSVVVLSGEPGVGKTTLAYMLSLSYLQAENLEGFVWANSISDIYSRIEDEKKQVFILDDFWGSILNDERKHGNYEKRLEQVIKTFMQKNSQKRLIITTREYILQQGLLQHPELKEILNKYALVCTMEEYSVVEKVQILFSHLYASDLDFHYVYYLYFRSSRLAHHPNYNPRVLALFLERQPEEDCSPQSYFEILYEYLDDPSEFWHSIFIKLSLECQVVALLLIISSTPMSLGELKYCYQEYVRGLNAQIKCKNIKDVIIELEKTMIRTYYNDDVGDIMISFINPGAQDYLYTHLEKNSEQIIPTLLNCCKFYNQFIFLLKHCFKSCSEKTQEQLIYQCIIYYNEYGNSYIDWDQSWDWDAERTFEESRSCRFAELLQIQKSIKSPKLFEFLERTMHHLCSTIDKGGFYEQYINMVNLPNLIVRCTHEGMRFSGAEIIEQYFANILGLHHILEAKEFRKIFPDDYSKISDQYLPEMRKNIESIILKELESLDIFGPDLYFEILMFNLPEKMQEFGVKYTDEFEEKITDILGMKPVLERDNKPLSFSNDESMDWEELELESVIEEANFWLLGPIEYELKIEEIEKTIVKTIRSPKLRDELLKIASFEQVHYLNDYLWSRQFLELLISTLNSETILKLPKESELLALMVKNITHNDIMLAGKFFAFCVSAFVDFMCTEEPVFRLTDEVWRDLYERFLVDDERLHALVMQFFVLVEGPWIRFVNINVFILCYAAAITKMIQEDQIEDYEEVCKTNTHRYIDLLYKESSLKGVTVHNCDYGTYYIKNFGWERCLYRLFQELDKEKFIELYVKPQASEFLKQFDGKKDDEKVLDYIKKQYLKLSYNRLGEEYGVESRISHELVVLESLSIVDTWAKTPERLSKAQLKKLEQDKVICEVLKEGWEIKVYKIDDINLLKTLGIYGNVLELINNVENWHKTISR